MAKKKTKAKAKQRAAPSISETIISEVKAEAYKSKFHPVFMKVCRLCESKDGPFLNIFDADKVTAKKIEEVMPFVIAKNDDLPHKICFRCSAKLEELYEFIQKCIRTQENLRKAIGQTGSFITKTKLNKTNIMTNDDICDAVIKKAMEGIKDMPLKSSSEEDSPQPGKRVTRRNEPVKKDSTSDDNDDMEPNLKQVKMSLGKCDDKSPTIKPQTGTTPPSKLKNAEPLQSTSNKSNESEKKPSGANVNSLSFDNIEDSNSSNDEVEKVKEKPFNIMDYISMIKVNGVGVLFQCKLCNRNFLKKEVVESHNCAKNGVPKVEVPKVFHAPEPPKVPTVKYIKIDDNSKTWKSNKNNKDSRTDSKNSSQRENSEKEEDSGQSVPKAKPKPKAGPASKTRRTLDTDSVNPETSNNTIAQGSPIEVTKNPSVQMPSVPKLNGRYKLVPGPNNIFTLVEDASGEITAPDVETPKPGKKRKSNDVENVKSNLQEQKAQSPPPEIADVQQTKPYPVGLFQTVGHSARLYEQPIAPAPAPFTTPAMKKQSYTIVQTGNPSKLLISTKALAEPEVPKKRQRKSRIETREDTEPEPPYKVTLEDVAPPKDTGFFTFINVDPLLQPSYVLPTDNIIQESQISTSTAVSNAGETSKEKDKYACNMCGESFSREKKLLTHIQSHYKKMDEEDELRTGKTSKRKTKK